VERLGSVPTLPGNPWPDLVGGTWVVLFRPEVVQREDERPSSSAPAGSCDENGQEVSLWEPATVGVDSPAVTSHTHGTPRDRTGTLAVPFELTDSAGVSRRLSDHANHWLLLVFHRHLA
jgi:hypothetical protein